MTGVPQQINRKEQAGKGKRECCPLHEIAEYIRLCLGMDDEPVQSLWVKIRGQNKVVYVLVSVYYHLIRKKLTMGKSFRFADPGSHGGLNHPDICWKDNTGNHICIDENFLTQMMDDLVRGGTLLDRTHRKKAEVVEEEKVGGSLGCCDHEMVEFVILKGGDKANSMITTLDYRTADFVLLKDLLGRIPREMVMERKADQESWFIFKDHLLQA